MFPIAKCRGDWDLVLHTFWVLAKREPLRNAKFQFFLRAKYVFFRKLPWCTVVLRLDVTKVTKSESVSIGRLWRERSHGQDPSEGIDSMWLQSHRVTVLSHSSWLESHRVTVLKYIMDVCERYTCVFTVYLSLRLSPMNWLLSSVDLIHWDHSITYIWVPWIVSLPFLSFYV